MTKKVRFNKANIHLIRYTKEYAECGLWWSTTDQIEAKKSCFREIEMLMLSYGRMRLSEALKLLYQPNNITYNEELEKTPI